MYCNKCLLKGKKNLKGPQIVIEIGRGCAANTLSFNSNSNSALIWYGARAGCHAQTDLCIPLLHAGLFFSLPFPSILSLFPVFCLTVRAPLCFVAPSVRCRSVSGPGQTKVTSVNGSAEWPLLSAACGSWDGRRTCADDSLALDGRQTIPPAAHLSPWKTYTARKIRSFLG